MTHSECWLVAAVLATAAITLAAAPACAAEGEGTQNSRVSPGWWQEGN